MNKENGSRHLWKSNDHSDSSSRDIWFPKELVIRNKVIKVEFKPLDVSDYCRQIFERCSRTLIMSATILDTDAFCKSVGIELDSVKFVQAGSDFPIENRPIFQTNTAYLNYDSLKLETTQQDIAKDVDKNNVDA